MRTLKECARKYYFQYYGYHNGWLQDADEQTKTIYRLKYLKPIDALFGEFFHSTVKEAIQTINKDGVTSDNFRRHINRRVKEAYQQSKECLNYWKNAPKKFYMINEVYYNGDISREKKNAIIEKVKVCSQNILKNDSFQEVFQKNVRVLELDELRSFDVNGMTAFVKIDTFYQKETGKFIVIDWKTSSHGGSLEEIDQLLIYALYICKRYGVKVDDIEFRLEYVMENKCESFSFVEKDLEMIERRIYRDIEIIKSYLENVSLNKPQPVDRFKEYQRKNLCKYCNYREVCM